MAPKRSSGELLESAQAKKQATAPHSGKGIRASSLFVNVTVTDSCTLGINAKKTGDNMMTLPGQKSNRQRVDNIQNMNRLSDTRNTSLKHASKNAKKKLRIHQVFSFILQSENYSYNL